MAPRYGLNQMLVISTLQPCPVGLSFPMQQQHVLCRSVAHSLQQRITLYAGKFNQSIYMVTIAEAVEHIPAASVASDPGATLMSTYKS